MGKKLRGFLCYLLFSLFLSAFYPAGVRAQAPGAWINEFSLEADGITGSSRVEVVVRNADSVNLDSFVLTLYDAEGEPAAPVHDLASFEEGESSGSYRFYHKEVTPAAALSLDYEGTLIQFVSNREEFQAVAGPAEGLQALHTGLQPLEGASAQLTGAGEVFERFNWSRSDSVSFGSLNENQHLHTVVQFARSTLSVSEAQGNVSIPVFIEGTDSSRVTVRVSLLQIEGYSDESDFLGEPSGTVTFFEDAADGDVKNVIFMLNDDETYEGRESALFRLSVLSAGESAPVVDTDTLELVISDNDRPDVVINEIMADPESDIDGNGSRDDDSDDQFVELLNNESEPVAVDGWTVSDDAGDVRYTFPSETLLPASGGLLLFSRDDDGSPSGLFGGSQVHISDVPLELGRTADDLVLRDQNGIEVDRHSYGAEANSGQSLVRSPDGSGPFGLHGEIESAPFSPGTRTDGSNFTNSAIVGGREGWRLLGVPAGELSVNQLGPEVAVQGYPGYAPGQSKSYYAGYDGSSFTESEAVENSNLIPGKGFLLYFFAPDPEDPSIEVLLDATSGVQPESDVNVALHSEGDSLNLLGNPFNAPLDLSDIQNWTGGNGSLQSRVAQFWDEETESFIPATLNDNLIPSWHGFVIKNRDADELTIPVSARSDRSAAEIRSSRQGYMAFTLDGEDNASGSVTADRAAVIYFHEEAEHDWDLLDAEKLAPFGNRYALLSFRGEGPDGETPVSMAQDARPFALQGGLSFDMDFTARNMAGEFVLSWQREALPDTWHFTLTDNQTGIQIDMNAGESYRFTYEPDNSSSSTTIQAAEESPGTALPAALALEPVSEDDPRFTVRVSSADGEPRVAQAAGQAKLNPNYPNPFNSETYISFELTEPVEVQLNVYTIVGQRIAILVDGMREAGDHDVLWNAAGLPSGIYIAQLEVAGEVFIRKMTLIK